MKNSQKKRNKKKAKRDIVENNNVANNVVDKAVNHNPVDDAIRVLKEEMRAKKESYDVIAKEGIILYSQEDKLVEYDNIVESIKVLEARKKEIEKYIQSEMKEYEVAYIGDRSITWKTQLRSSFDSKRFKMEYPELAEEFMKNTTYRTFKVK